MTTPEPGRTPRRQGLQALATTESGDTHPLFHAIGGVLGILETLLPGFAFVILYLVTGLPSGIPWVALIVSAGASAVFFVVRLIRRESVTQAVVGLVGVAASVVLVIVSGRPENNFLVGIITNAVYGLVVLISLLVRWPLVGVVVGLFSEEKTAWRKDRESMRVFMWTTLMWLAMFVIRLAVELPLYVLSLSSTGAEHQSLVTALAVTKVALGLPLYVPVLAATWLLVRGLWREKHVTPAKNKVS